MGVAFGMALTPAGASAQDPAARTTARAAEPVQTSRPGARLAFQAALDSYRRGDYDIAAAYFQQAQAGQEELSAAERHDLATWLQLNGTALRARREGRSQLSLAEQAMRQGHTQDAIALLKAAIPNQQFLTAADKQSMQQLTDRLMPGNNGAAQTAGSSAAPLFQARTKLKQARIYLSRGNYDAAQALAIEADRLGATYQPGEDTPQKVFEDINRSRVPSDAKSLLAAARAALNRGNLDEAERLAHASEKASSVLKVYMWGDSPSKVLKDVQAARTRQLAKRETQDKTTTSSTGLQALKPPAGQSGSTTATAGDQPQHPANPTEAARQLIKAAHKALQAGDVAQAKELTEKARQLKPELYWWEDTPDKLQDEIRHVEAVKHSKDAKQGVAEKDKWDDPRSLLKQGRQLLDAGKLNEAQTLAQRANAKPTRWSMFEDTPDKLLEDIQDARVKRDREESVRVLAEARKTYEKGDLKEAEQLVNRAQRLHGSYKFYELGDRPQKLLAEIETAKSKQRKPSLPPAPSDVHRDAQASNRTAQESTKTSIEKPSALAVNPPPVLPSSTSRPPSAGERVASNSDYQSPYLQTAPSKLSDGKKVQAQLLLTQARQLQREGRLLEARQKALEAQKVGATFGPQEDSPELAMLALSALCQKRIESLVQHAADYVATGDADPSRYQRAEFELGQAKQLAISFRLDTQLIDSKLAWLQQLRTRTPLPESNTGHAQIMPVQHQEVVAARQPDSASQQGQTLLNQARMELRAGQTGNARRLAEAAYAPQYGVQAEAAQVLRSIDAEEFNQRILTANHSFEAGLSAFYRREYSKAGMILRSIDPHLLAEGKQNRLKEIMLVPEMQPGAVAQVRYPATMTGTGNQPGVARVSDVQPGVEAPRTPAVSPEADFAQQFKAMQEVKFQELRTKGMEAMTDATKRFEIGETDRALEILQEYTALLQTADIDSAQVAILRRQVDARLQRFRMLKEQQDFQKLQASQKGSFNRLMEHNALVEQDKKKQLTELMNQYHALFKEGKYKEAEMYAMRAHELDPDDAMAAAAIYTARTQYNLTNYNRSKRDRERIFEEGLTQAEEPGPYVDSPNPLSIDPKISIQNRDRKTPDILSLPNIKSEREREIYRKLDAPISSSMDFKDTPMQQVLDDLRVTTGVNIIVDDPALHEAGIVLTQPVTMRLEGVALKSALNLLLHQVHLTYVVQDEVLNITTEEHARGKRVTKIHPVVDLVIPVNNSPPPDSLMKALGQTSADLSTPKINSATPWLGQNSMAGGQNVSMSQMGNTPAASSGGFTISKGERPKETIEDVLIKLITNTISPQSWASMGGQGTIEYFPLGFALVINQTPDVQEQIQDLLQALRRLQDQEVAVEVRFITVAEEFYERIGLDFSINIRNDQTRYEPQIVSQQFKPFGFINHFTPSNFLTGLTPAGSFTQDLNIPIKATSFNMGIPPFGGFPNAPGADGGLSLGLAFLSDIEVYLLMDAAQGDQRTNVMQAPKLTMFNGQTATLAVTDQQFFVVGVTVIQIGGQVVFVPTNVPIPTGGVTLTILPTISADRRFVRLSLAPALVNLASANVPLFPITTFITPVFEGGSVGQPIPFTQFLQQPAFSTITVTTTVNVPDGGTVLVGGLKRLSEGRNEYGPPILSKIPYIDRLFKNVGYGRETESLLMMVTPRIIINEEEEAKVLGPAGAPAGAPGAAP